MEPATIGLFIAGGGLFFNALTIIFTRHDRYKSKERELEVKIIANTSDIKVLENELKNVDRRMIESIQDIKKMDERWQAQLLSIMKEHINSGD